MLFENLNTMLLPLSHLLGNNPDTTSQYDRHSPLLLQKPLHRDDKREHQTIYRKRYHTIDWPPKTYLRAHCPMPNKVTTETHLNHIFPFEVFLHNTTNPMT